MEEIIYVVVDLDSDKKDVCQKAFEDYDKAKDYVNQLASCSGYHKDYLIIDEICLVKN